MLVVVSGGCVVRAYGVIRTTGTIDVEQIEQTYRQLWLRGMQIIAENPDSLSRNAQVLNMFEGLIRGERESK